jgi:hypothetical protein
MRKILLRPLFILSCHLRLDILFVIPCSVCKRNLIIPGIRFHYRHS